MLVPSKAANCHSPFDVLKLVSNENVESALNELAATLTESNYPVVLDDALCHPSVLELILSNLSCEVPLAQWLLAHFPSDVHLFANSLTARIMERLSTFFLMQSTRETQRQELSSESAKFVKSAPNVLRALLALSFLEESESPTEPSAFPTFRASQRNLKQMKKLAAKNFPHEKVLVQAGIVIPCCRAEADEQVARVYEKLRNIFEQYLIKIRTPQISANVKKTFIRTDLPEPLTVVTRLAPIPSIEPKVEAKPDPALAINEPTPAAASAPLHNLKLYHYYDTPDGFGQWNILLSSRADREIRTYHRTNPTMYQIIMRKIFDLSNGHFSFDNQKKLNGPSSEIPIYEAKMSGDLRLVYHVDCITCPTDNQSSVKCKAIPSLLLSPVSSLILSLITALKIFGFYTHAKMDHRLWDSVAHHLHSQGKEYRLRCLKRERRDGDTGDVYVPASFPAREEDEEEKEGLLPIPNTMAQENNELHSLITLEKYVALSKDVLDSIESGRDAAFPFELSKYEKKIVQHSTSCYVLGRSGTGKTTTMLYKMLWVEKAYRMHTAGLQHPRQIFVTRSAVLARKVEEHFLTYTSAFREVKSRSRKLRDEEASSNDLINYNNSSAWKESKLAFSDLEDSDFPLFIPLDDLYYLLEADIDWDGKPGSVLAPHFRPIAELKGKFISFQRFLGEYWPTFSRRLTNTLNPALVFNEIIGSILGSERVLSSTDGHLSKPQYLESSRAASSNFSQEQRALIYDIFSSYKELKRQKDDYDISDRSRTIIAAMRHAALTIKKIEYLYVDETQDNLLIDALVLRSICRNPDGLFWAGDTAQTISAGSTFRFDDLKAFMYRVEEERLSRLAKQKAEKQLSKVSPHVFQLATNFRSHAGIVDCAHVVVELIKKFFPHTIDMLKRERGVVEGAKPMFCNGFDADQFKEGGSFSSAMISAEKIELGAHQCILVRDEEARQRFVEQVGDIGLVVTLYDSKGLEFNDVVLLNFFEDSILTQDQWRVVLNDVSGVYAPKFDLVKHSAICLELKSLYVAITRARNNLRIIDSSDKSEPMKILWEKLGCITEVSFHEAFSNFAVQSSAEDWNQRAKEFFDQEKYALARDSYLRGQNHRHAAVADAFYERERAQRTPHQAGRNKTSQRAENFTKAAEAFVRCAEEAEGASARKTYHHLSGECFEEAHLLMRAVEHYRLAEDFTRAAVLLRKLGSFDEVKELLLKHEAAIDSDIFETLKDVVRLYYVSSRQYSKAHELFDSTEEEMEYLEDRNLDLAQADLLISLGRITEAADVHLADGRFEDAISLLINDPSQPRSYYIKASNAVLRGLMTYITFGSDPRSSENADRLLSLSRKIPIDVWAAEESNVQEIMMYRFLYSSDLEKLYGLAKTFLACKNSSAALLILDYIFTNTSLATELDKVDKAAPALAHFSSYTELLRDAAFFGDPCEEKNQRFFGVVQQDADSFSFRPRTLFANFQAPKAEPLLSSHVSEGFKKLSKADITSLFRQCLQDRLRQRVAEENRLCRTAPAFNPCLRHIALKDCRYPGRCQQPHITMTKAWFLDWIRIHLLQIMIYGSVIRLEHHSELQKEQFFWLKKFFEAANPPDHTLGSISHLSVAFYEEMRAPLTAVRSWIREITASWAAHPPFRFLTMAMLTSDMAFTFDRREASRYMFRASFIQPGGFPAAFIRGVEGNNSLVEMLLALQGVRPNSLRLGASFIEHVMKHPFKVDIGVFCTFIERICGQYSALYRYLRRGSFHNIMLPHSWLRRFINEFDTLDARNKNCPPPFFVLEALESLIRILHFDTADSNLLIVQGDRYTNIPYHLRAIYVSRICRVLGLLAYNIHVDDFRDQIQQIFKRLLSKGSLMTFPWPYRYYLAIQSHADLVRIVRGSLRDSPFDNMLELRDASEAPGPSLRGVRVLRYRTYDDLVGFFAKSGSSASLDEVEELEAEVTVATEPEQEDIAVQEAEDDSDEEQGLPDDEEDGKGHTVQLGQDNQGVDVKLAEELYVEHSAEENMKASIIQKAFRRVREMKKLQSSPGLDGRSYRLFMTYQETLKEPKMQKIRDTSQYRLRYLGALPLLIACIDTIYDQLQAAKNEVKQQLNPRRRVNHEMLDELSERLTKLNVNVKTITKLKRELGLNNPLHQRADMEELRSNVQQVQDALRNRKFSIELSQDVKESLEFVYRIVSKKPSKPTEKMPKKPILNAADEDDYL